MTLHEYVLFDPLISERDAESMVRLCERFGGYGMYSAEKMPNGVASPGGVVSVQPG